MEEELDLVEIMANLSLTVSYFHPLEFFDLKVSNTNMFITNIPSIKLNLYNS